MCAKGITFVESVTPSTHLHMTLYCHLWYAFLFFYADTFFGAEITKINIFTKAEQIRACLDTLFQIHMFYAQLYVVPAEVHSETCL